MTNDVIVPSNTLFCGICGLPCDEPPWGSDGNVPSFDYCDCCGVEWGYQDCLPVSRMKYRKQWAIGGFKWCEPACRPEGWEPLAQLRNILPDEAIADYAAVVNTPPVRPFGR